MEDKKMKRQDERILTNKGMGDKMTENRAPRLLGDKMCGRQGSQGSWTVTEIHTLRNSHSSTVEPKEPVWNPWNQWRG